MASARLYFGTHVLPSGTAVKKDHLSAHLAPVSAAVPGEGEPEPSEQRPAAGCQNRRSVYCEINCPHTARWT